MARQPLIINSLPFHSQQDAITYFRAMLGRYRDGEEILGKDFEMLLALLERHPRAVTKIGGGVKRLYKDKTTKTTRCFWIERQDGTVTDFSYREAIRAKEKSLYQEFAEACRQAVDEDLRLMKQNHFAIHADAEGKVKCDITGERIAFHESHLDHKKPLTFQTLVQTFMGAHEIEITREMLSMHQDGQFQTAFVDVDLKEKFRHFHHKIAELRIIQAGLNLSLGGAERITPSLCPVVIPTGL
ncbi:DCL family protein [Nitrosococcus wardiae]|uniref:DUF3223 domain-containing protein n=1 Tax=Nitrosococcus wardiae TaxID=1814290 RepID=A0A4P7C3S2_9GAMM|nr:DCL family protein [Nitrosococcus wardiae]QBQ56244.1 DUF3223 domain-containing protein [Nitrosococcus wardiae]